MIIFNVLNMILKMKIHIIIRMSFNFWNLIEQYIYTHIYITIYIILYIYIYYNNIKPRLGYDMSKVNKDIQSHKKIKNVTPHVCRIEQMDVVAIVIINEDSNLMVLIWISGWYAHDTDIRIFEREKMSTRKAWMFRTGSLNEDRR